MQVSESGGENEDVSEDGDGKGGVSEKEEENEGNGKAEDDERRGDEKESEEDVDDVVGDAESWQGLTERKRTLSQCAFTTTKR